MSRPLSLLAGLSLLAVAACDRSPTEPGNSGNTLPSDPTPDAVGELFTLNTQTESGSACENPDYQTARVEAISQHAVVAADTANPADGFTRQDFEDFAQQFDDLIAPLAEANFGEWTEIGGGRVVLFFTKEVNRLTEFDADAFVAGFFFARDLFGRERIARDGAPDLSACAHSNERELLYLRVPDPKGDFGSEQKREDVLRFMPATIIHELQHLINASRRLYIVPRGGDWSEVTWLNEALSHTAEELLFYQVSGRAPSQDISPQELSVEDRSALNRHQLFNFRRLWEFLEAPGESSPYSPEDALATRGAAWSLLRYLTDRVEEQPSSFYRALVDSYERGLPNLAQSVGGSPVLFEGLSRWSVGMYADGRVDGLWEPYQDLSWNHAATWHHYTEDEPYPIHTHPLSSGEPVEVAIQGGGSAYFRFGVAAGQRGAVELAVDEDPGEATLVSSCDEEVSLEPGEAEEFEGADLLVICVDGPDGPTGSGEYVLVSTAATGDTANPVELAARSENTTTAAGPPSPVIAGLAGADARPFGDISTMPHRDHEFDARLREQERVELGPLVGVGGAVHFTSSVESPTGGDALRHTLLRTR